MCEATSISYILTKHDYLLQDKIGEGANGECYLVESTKYQKTFFVCKCIPIIYGFEKSRVEQYHAEIESLSQLPHKNIVQIYDCFSEANFLFLIMEYCENGNLITFIQNNVINARFIDYTYIRKILLDILQGLQYCHEITHISHHDIKPGNIIFDKYGNAKLCDFGFSAVLHPNADSEGDYYPSVNNTNNKFKTSGSLPFMSPQLLSFSLDLAQDYDMFAADIWAFGITAYMLVTGRQPFSGYTKKDILKAQTQAFSSKDLYENKSSIFKYLPKDLPEDIREIIIGSLQFEEKNRLNADSLVKLIMQWETKQPKGMIRHHTSCPILNDGPGFRFPQPSKRISMNKRIVSSSILIIKKPMYIKRLRMKD